MMSSTLLIAAVLAASPEPAVLADPDIEAVRARDDALQQAHGSGDLDTYRAGLSKHYVYIDIGGKRVTAELLSQRREADQRRLVSSESLEEDAVKLSDTAVMLRGLERSLATYYGGLPRQGETRWTALWIKEDDGVWRLVAETATPVRGNAGLPHEASPQPRAAIDALAGAWTLATTPPLTLRLRADDDGLVGGIEGQSVEWTFRPASPTRYFARERPFELRFDPAGRRMEMITWGTATAATRVVE